MTETSDARKRREEREARRGEPFTIKQALSDVHRLTCARDQHDPICRVLSEGITWLSDRAALNPEVTAVLCVEPEADVPVVPVATSGTVEDCGVTGQKAGALSDPSGHIRVFARKLRGAVSKAHGRIVP